MKKIRHFLSFCMLMLVILAACYTYRSCQFLGGRLLGVDFSREKNIDETPSQIESIRQIGEWEFLSINDEEMIDTFRSHLLSPDDCLVRIYKGTLRLGIDFRQCEEHWAQFHDDTIWLNLPPICLLDTAFIDEARTQSFYESGKWDYSVREQMYLRARKCMIQRCLTQENIKEAEKNALSQLDALFRSLGFSNVVTTISPSSLQP